MYPLKFKILKKVVMPFIAFAIFYCSNSFAEINSNSIFGLYPNPYQILNYGITNKLTYQNQIQGHLITYLSNNCDEVKNKKENIRFCKNSETAKSLKFYEDKIKELMSSNSLILGEDMFLLSSLLASNFEMDFLLSQDQVSNEVAVIIEYLKVRNQFAEELTLMTDVFFDIHPGVSISGRTTVVPTYYALSSSSSIFETLIRYLQVADCMPGQKLCNYYLYKFYEDFNNALTIYKKDVVDPTDQMLSFILNGNYGNFGLYEERIWMKDIHQSLEENNYSYFLDKMLTSAGHVDDKENKFKSTYVQNYQIKKLINSELSRIQEKSQKWKVNSAELIESINKSDQANIPFRKELLVLMTKEISQHKKIIVDQIKQLDDEVQDASH